MPNNNDLSDDEKNLFRKNMSGVKPLQQKSKNTYREPTQIVLRKKISQNNFQSPIKPTVEFPNRSIYVENKYPLINSEEIIYFIRGGISKKQFLDLKNAKNRYEAALDLHGLSPNNATIKLSNFINYQHKKNSKIVLIIHGKSGKDHTPPIIKNLTNSLLRQIPEVLAFHSAKSKDGGTGAVYVLLKSSRLN